MFGPVNEGGSVPAMDWLDEPAVVRRLQVQNFIASIVAQVAEVGVFFAAAAALVAGALALR